MKQTEVPKEFLIEGEPSNGLGFDPKRVLSRALRFWYIIGLSVLVALMVAFLMNRYATKIYPVTASIIVKEADDISGAELLYNNPLVNFKRNYLNETYIVRSYPLIQRVIEDLNFDVAFYKQGNVLTTEAYKELAVEAIPVRDIVLQQRVFNFKVLDEHQFEMQMLIENDDYVSGKFLFGDTINFGGFNGVFRIRNTDELGEIINESLIFAYTPASILANGYVESLKAEWAEEGAGVINLSMNSPNPRKGMDFLSGLITQYQNNDLEIKNETASRTVEFISDQLRGISDSLRAVEGKLERFKNQNVVTDLTGEALRLYQKVEQIESEKLQLKISKSYYDYLVEYITKNKEFGQIILPSSVGITDPILGNLVARMNEIQLDIKMLGKEKNPLMTESIKRVNEMRQDVIESVRNQESTNDIKIKFLNEQIEDIETQLARLPLAERTLVSIQRRYALQENLYIFLLQKQSEAAITKASNTSDIVLVNPPRIGDMISPRKKVNYILAVLLGLALPALFFVGVEVLDNRIQSRDDIEKITSIPFVAGLGHKTTINNLAVFAQPKSIIAESFRGLRSSLTYFVGQKEKAVFLVSSSISGEGKTFTSVNLASILALSGKKTLIIGADMRRPKIADDFDLGNDVGLSTFLAGLGNFEDVRQKTKYENLDLVSGGPVPPNPSELLLTDRMTAFMTDAKSRYDFIIIDSPPLAIVTDAFVLVPFADHTIFIVRQNYTPKNMLRTVEDFYATGKLSNISIVLNDIYRSGPGYGYNYGNGYSYGYQYGSSKHAGGYYTE